jgi:hypothetical protein
MPLVSFRRPKVCTLAIPAMLRYHRVNWATGGAAGSIRGLGRVAAPSPRAVVGARVGSDVGDG